MNEMKCPFCGKDIPDDSVFCPECGKRVKAKISKKSLIVILSLVAVAVIVALVLLLSNKSSDSDDEKELTPKEEAIAISKKYCECQKIKNDYERIECTDKLDEEAKRLEKKYDSATFIEIVKISYDYINEHCGYSNE